MGTLYTYYVKCNMSKVEMDLDLDSILDLILDLDLDLDLESYLNVGSL